MPCAEQGFVTVKVLDVDGSSKSAKVEIDPEGAACVAAAQAAVAILQQAAEQAALDSGLQPALSVASQQPHINVEGDGGLHATQPAAVQPASGEAKRKGKRAAHKEPQWLLSPPAAATAAFTDPLSHRNALFLEDSSEASGSEGEQSGEATEAPTAEQSASLLDLETPGAPEYTEEKPLGAERAAADAATAAAAAAAADAAAAAAADAAAAVTAAFTPRPPLVVPLVHLRPYTAVPLPPHPVADDSASFGSLSTAALLQQLQHRYLRNEIYTYAAHVLLAVNPYKPLPHLYTTEQIVLYRHWKEVSRAYRRKLNESEDEEDADGLAAERKVTRSSEAIRSILSRLPGLLPVDPASNWMTSGPTASGEVGEGGFNGWANGTGAEVTQVGDKVPAAAIAAAERALKDCHGKGDRPPPHPFVVAEEALRRLVGTQTNQTIVVSGQSGAGKTETSKQLMMFLTHVSTAPEGNGELSGSEAAVAAGDPFSPLSVSEQRRRLAALTGGVQTLREAAELRERIVSCNAIFESFGNAATRRNHNSSRIGRLTLLHFDSGGLLRGGSLRTYLLEAARLTAHKRGDRNFHVFYQLLKGASEEQCSSLGLTRQAAAYRMLQPQDSDKFLQKAFARAHLREAPQPRGLAELQDEEQVPTVVDQENFKAMTESLKGAEFSLSEVEELLQLLAGLLHLSNIAFTDSPSGLLELHDESAHASLTHAASLLGLDGEELKELLRCRRMRLKGDIVHTQRNQQQSYSACCSVIKFIYSRLFDYIVQRLNESAARQMRLRQQQVNLAMQSSGDNASHNSIGILDIYGFESFGLENGLEQLCINYANEKQQQLFVQRVIEEEIALYTREGIANPAVTAAQRNRKRPDDKGEDSQSNQKGRETHAFFKASLEQSLFASLPDTSLLLRDLQEGVFRRLDDSCRLLAQGQQRDDLHFWKDLFAYCVAFTQEPDASKRLPLQPPQQQMAGAEQYILFCLKGIHGVRAADAAATGQLLQHLQREDLTSIGLVGADHLAVRASRGAAPAGAAAAAAAKAAAGKVQERVFAVKHFAGTVLYGTDGWLELNNDRIEYELERLVANSAKALLRQAMEQHEARQQQEGAAAATAGGGQFSSITKRFVKSVKDLGQELQGPHMQLHFIRCFIPNGFMRPDNFERKTVLQQLQHSGTLALVDILHTGFPHRMPLRAVAARLRGSLEPLVQLRLQEQEQAVQQLMASKDQVQHTPEALALLEEELKKKQHMLQTLRHCNPARVRDRTLVSASLGLLPQCRPGTFICGVSMLCFKAAAYDEVAELMTDPTQFFKAPEDLCRLVVAIQRLRWRVATRMVLQVHPTLLWLHRRALLMKRIKEEMVKTAVQLLLLKKYILRPLRERVARRLNLRRGIRILEQLMLCRGLLALRQHRAALAAAEAASKAASVEPSSHLATAAPRKCPPPLDLKNMRNETAGPGGGEDHPPHQGNPLWNALLLPLSPQGQDAGPLHHHLALHVGRGLYSIKFRDPALPKDSYVDSEQQKDQPMLQLQPLPVAACSGLQNGRRREHSADQTVKDLDSRPTPSDSASSSRPHLVTVAKHPTYNDLFLACNSAAELLLFDTPGSVSAEPEEKPDLKKGEGGHVRCPPTPTGEPSTSLPLLHSPSALHAEEQTLRRSQSCRSPTSRRERRPQTSPFQVEKRPLPDHLRHCETRADGAFPPTFLPKNPIPPSQWLPRDLLQLLASKSQKQQPQGSETSSPRPPTVRPLRVSFAHPITADYALVLCFVQSGHSSSGGTGQLAIVLVDLTKKRTARWLPLSFPPGGISACVRRHPAYLEYLSSLSSTEPGSSKKKKIQSSPIAGDAPQEQSQRLTARHRSNVLSTIQLKPLWGNMWAVAGPALLALFSVNLHFLQHPPEGQCGEPSTQEPPMSLLWNLPVIPRLQGMTFHLADSWLTGCTYTRVPPAWVSRARCSKALMQFLQQMPNGPVARSLEAKMQRLLLFVTAENKLLLMQWSEKRTHITTGSGNLVLLDEIQLAYPVLQFLRQQPEEKETIGDSVTARSDRGARLLKAFPWESPLLKHKPSLEEASRSNNYPESHADTTSGLSDAGCKARLSDHTQDSSTSRAKENQAGSLSLDFPSYGLAMVDRTSGRITHSLDQHAVQPHLPETTDTQGHLLAITPLPSDPGLLASIWSLPHGGLRLCLGDEAANWRAVENFELQK
ncbi:hypothetical protein Efla_006544 [Eimeria flavescens]